MRETWGRRLRGVWSLLKVHFCFSKHSWVSRSYHTGATAVCSRVGLQHDDAAPVLMVTLIPVVCIILDCIFAERGYSSQVLKGVLHETSDARRCRQSHVNNVAMTRQHVATAV